MAATKQAELDFLMTEEGENSEPSEILPAGGTRLRLVAPLGVFMVLAVIACLALSPSVDPDVSKHVGAGFQAGLTSSRRRSHRSGSSIVGLSEVTEEADEEDEEDGRPPTFQEALEYDKDKDGLLSKEEALSLLEDMIGSDPEDLQELKETKGMLEEHFPEADKDGDGLDEKEFENILSAFEGGPGEACEVHSDCSDSEPFCYEDECSPCSECHFCQDGIDGTCGPCGEGFPTKEDGTCLPESEGEPEGEGEGFEKGPEAEGEPEGEGEGFPEGPEAEGEPEDNFEEGPEAEGEPEA